MDISTTLARLSFAIFSLLMSSTDSMAILKDAMLDRMQVDPGYIPISDMLEYEASGKPVPGCGGKEADIYFLLDASNGVGHEDFKRSLNFVSDLVPSFDPDKTRIGVITYNEKVYHTLQLGQRRGHKLQAAVKDIPFEGGEPDTGSALRYVRRKAFSPRFARPGIAQLVIVVTNGRSRNTKEVMSEARRVRKSGIYVYAVYPSDQADSQELTAIASDPLDHFLFAMDSYNIVAFTEQLLGSSPCDVEVHPPEEKVVCDTRRPADIVFALDYATIGVKKAKKVLKFIKGAAGVLDIASDRIHVGIVTNDCPEDLDITLEDHYTRDGFLEDARNLEMPSQAELLKKVRRRSFSRFFGARVGVQKTLVLFIDDKMDNPTSVIQEATRTKARKIEIIVVAIGSRLNLGNIEQVATKESIVRVPSYDDLRSASDKILERVCKGL